MSMNRLIILNRYFAPDESATSRMASSLAFGLAERGWNIHAVASRQLYETPASLLPLRETIRGVTIHRIWTSRFGRRTLISRAIDYLTFYASAFLWLLRFTHRNDLVVISTDPPLLSILASAAAAITGATQINWLHDIYPEVAAVLGISPPGPAHRLLQRLRDLSLSGATMNVAIGDRMAAYLYRRGVAKNRVAVIHNWSDGSAIKPVPPQANPLREHWGLVGKFVVGYSGNLGRGHDFATILSAARALLYNPDIVFLFVGAGHHLSWIQNQISTHRLTNVVLRPYQPDENLSQTLGLPDLHLVTLRPGLEGLMVPSKFYGVAAAGRPTVYIGDIAGEIPAILRDADCGHAISIGDIQGLVDCILRLRGSPEQLERWSRNARAVFARRFDRRHAVDRWSAVLHGLAAAHDVEVQQAVGASD
jgi:glycosyltransferase involved in cell wall biosynthesis